jgi:hypothetical protein
MGWEVVYRDMTWLQPPGSNDWLGFLEKNKAIEVRMTDDALHWTWTLIGVGTHGAIPATGNHDTDRFTAQTMAEFDFFDGLDRVPGLVGTASKVNSNA